jgi:hypothetical protein
MPKDVEVRSRRFLGQDVKGCAREMAAIEGGHEGGEIDQVTSRNVHEVAPGRHASEALRVHDPTGRLGEWNV